MQGVLTNTFSNDRCIIGVTFIDDVGFLERWRSQIFPLHLTYTHFLSQSLLCAHCSFSHSCMGVLLPSYFLSSHLFASEVLNPHSTVCMSTDNSSFIHSLIMLCKGQEYIIQVTTPQPVKFCDISLTDSLQHSCPC